MAGTTRLCACGCGQPTLPAKQTSTRFGLKKGEPTRYLRGHTFGSSGPGHVRWKGGIWHRQDGYTAITVASRTRKPEHVLIVERALGHALPDGAQVHHVNGQRGDNANQNLVACQDNGYHRLLHKRQRAMDECGDANAQHCMHCGLYDRQNNITVVNLKSGRHAAYHRTCNANASRRRNQAQRASA